MSTPFVRIRAALLALVPFLAVACGGGGGGGGGSAAPAITAPSTGSVWGGNRTIRWTGSGEGTVAVSLSSDGGATYAINLDSAAPNSGSYALDTVSLVDGVDYRARVVLPNGATLTSGTFAIDNTVPVTSLTSPLGNEILGGTPTIEWTTDDVHPGTVEIRLSSDGGVTFDTVIALNTPDDGVFEWTSSALTDGATYRVQIIATDRAANESVPSRSPQNFQLDNTPPIVALTAPTGGQTWSGTQSITWTTTEANPDTVTLTLSTDGGVTFATPIATDAPDSGSYSWLTGSAPDGVAHRVRIVATDAAGNASAPASSPASFTVQNLRLTGFVHYLDTVQDGALGAGDQLILKFDKPVTVNSPNVASLALGVAGDSFGAGAALAAGVELDAAVVTLGTGATLRTRGVFASDATAAGRPSGADIAGAMAANAIESTTGGLDAVPSGVKDLRPSPVTVVTPHATAGTVTQVAGADLDGDGAVDFVVAESTGVGVGILLGDGQGAFTASVGPLVQALDVELGDVDGDGAVDLIAATATGVQIALGNGDGTFGAPGTAFGGSALRCVAVVDADRDGDLDLALGNAGAVDRLYLNDGSGAFTDAGQSLAGGTTVELVVGDLDQDGDPDLVSVAGTGGTPVRVWLNNGAGVFSAGDTIAVTQAQTVALGDIDRDGDLDCVVGVLGQCEVYFNDGAGVFGATAQFLGNNDHRTLLLLDLDGDGDLDLATVKYLDGDRWWFNDGNGVFTESTVRGLSNQAVGAVAARIDGDADLDIFVAVDGAPHRVYLGSVAGGQPLADWTESAEVLPLVASQRVLLGDLDGDGTLDAVHTVLGGAPRVLVGDGAGAFALGATFATSGFVVGQLVDVDRDGDLDVVGHAAGSPNSWSIWRQGATGAFTSGATGLSRPISEFVDVDRDGTLDFIGVTGAGVAELWLGDGSGGFTESGVDLGTGSTASAALADLDGDGLVDITLSDASSLRIVRGLGGLSFTGAFTASSVTQEQHVLADVDRDGDLDLFCYSIASSPTQTRFVVVRNDGGMTFTVQPATGILLQTDALRLLDVDEDGDLDALSWSDNGGFLGYHVHLGDGTGTFIYDDSVAVPDIADVAVGDLDRDGDADLYIVRYDVGGGTAVAPVIFVRD